MEGARDGLVFVGRGESEESTQVFSTEFISAMHVDDSAPLDDVAIPIIDPWKQTYHTPIQVPSSAATSPLVREEPTAVKQYYKQAPYKQQGEYYNEEDPDWEPSQRQYQLDGQDERWLKRFNATPARRARGGAGALRREEMATLITKFEQQAFGGITRAFFEEVAASGLDRVCDVCLLPDSEEGNEMIFCDGCDTLVHQFCYGVRKIPEGDWFCRACEAKNAEAAEAAEAPPIARTSGPSCVLCPNRGGALKRVDDGAQWCHVQCGLWIPEAKFGDPSKMEPLLLGGVPASRERLHCYLCKLKVGACIQCNVPTCTTSFHVSCAVFNNLRMELVTTPNGTVRRNAYCVKHTNARVDADVEKQNRHVVNGPGKAVPEVMSLINSEFCDFVDVDGSVDDAEAGAGLKGARLAGDSVRAVFAYWVQRRRKAEGQPLIRQLCFTRSEIDRGLHRPDLEAERRSLFTLRSSLDSVRSMCEMVKERESTKRTLADLMQAEFAASLSSFSDSLGLDTSLTDMISIELEEEPPDKRLTRGSNR